MTNQSQRFLSLDVFRGMTICFMIIVNTPGSGAVSFAPLHHATWHGFTPTDLVFPSFLFAVGNAMSFSQHKLSSLGNKAFLAKVLRRAVLIFVLGYLMYWFPFFRINDAGEMVSAPLSHTRIMGVLQRIALCFLFASLMVRYLRTGMLVAASVALLAGYWVLLLLLGDAHQPYSLLGNAALSIDKALLGTDHMHRSGGIPFDPEGLLSTLPAIANVTAGYLAGRYLQQHGKQYQTLTVLLLAGCAMVLAALWWNMVFPVNKRLWTSPFVLLTTGIDLVVIAALVFAIEIKNLQAPGFTRFFMVFGKNPLFIYLLSELLLTVLYMIPVGNTNSVFTAINSAVFQALMPGPWGSLAFAVFYMLMCWLAGWWLHKRRIYIKV